MPNSAEDSELESAAPGSITNIFDDDSKDELPVEKPGVDGDVRSEGAKTNGVNPDDPESSFFLIPKELIDEEEKVKKDLILNFVF